MKLTYTGRNLELPSKQRVKLETKLEKLSKRLGRGKDNEAHVILRQERYLNHVEITMNAFDHALVGVGSNADLFTALSEAIEKLETQVVKLRTKWRDTHRNNDHKEETAAKAIAPEPAAKPSGNAKVQKIAKATSAKTAKKRVYRVNHTDGRKPMTVDEAMIEMDASQDYLVYRDAKTDKLSVLMRRGDGNFDLIES